MAYNLATTELSTIFMQSEEPLGSETLSKKFRFLLENDKIINQLFSNTIGIWECSWYYDSTVKGYNIGDAVWLNTEDANDFVKAHADTIKTYTDLNSQVLNKLPEFDEHDEEIIAAYKNAMSGYADVNLGRGVVLPPIYDIGDFFKPIQIAISLKNNNKSLLSDKTAWKTLFVNSDEDEQNIRNIIDLEEKDTLETHLLDYHLSGQEETVKAKLSDYLDVQNDVAYTDVSLDWYLRYNENPKTPLYGIDYVRYSIRKPFISNNGIVSQYQGVRYWKSGMIEHFGTIATNNEMFLDGNFLKVPLNWEIANDESGATAYERGELANSLESLLSTLETPSNVIPPKDNLINLTYEKSNVEVDGRKNVIPFKDNDYKISINAIFQTEAGINENYPLINYGEDKTAQNWNTNFLTTEIVEKNRRYFKIIANSRITPPYISYYAIGKGAF